MKRLLTFTLIALLLTACSAASTGTPISSTENSLPIETQLAVGTLQLAGTEQDISTEQAEELLVYWQVYKELSQRDTAAQAEIDGLVAQIEETMTDAQMQAITDMGITQQDVFAAMQSASSVVSNASSDSTVSIPSGGSGMPAGGPPDGGGGGMPSDMSGAAPAGTSSSQSATDTGSAVITGVPTTLVQAIIDTLQQKIVAQ